MKVASGAPWRDRFEFDTSRFELGFRVLTEVPTFQEVSGQEPGLGEEFPRIRAEGRESRGESLLGDFSISEIWIGSGFLVPESSP
jgi:hypothetical protein